MVTLLKQGLHYGNTCLLDA